MENGFSWLYWFYLLLAIVVSIFSLTYWVYKFAIWWQRRQRRFARRLKSRQEQEEKLATLREDREELTAQCEHLREQLGSFGVMARWLRKRSVTHKLHELEQRGLRMDEEIAQLTKLLAEPIERPGRPPQGR
jgi:biopolymer transport protein ExbB/TolQ